MLLGFLLAMASVPLAGGRLGRMADLRFRGVPVAVAALAVQVLVISVFPGLPAGAAAALHVVTYLAVGVVLVANWRVPGLVVLALGAGLNLAAIAANGGVMPATAEAVATAGQEPDGAGFTNSAATEDPRLLILGDVFAVPASWPLANVFSVGDVFVVVGAAVTMHATCGSRLAPPRAAAVATPRGPVAGA